MRQEVTSEGNSLVFIETKWFEILLNFSLIDSKCLCCQLFYYCLVYMQRFPLDITSCKFTYEYLNNCSSQWRELFLQQVIDVVLSKIVFIKKLMSALVWAVWFVHVSYTWHEWWNDNCSTVQMVGTCSPTLWCLWGQTLCSPFAAALQKVGACGWATGTKFTWSTPTARKWR